MFAFTRAIELIVLLCIPLLQGAKPPYTCRLRDTDDNAIEILSNGRLVGEPPQRVKDAAEAALSTHAADIGGTSPWTYTGNTYIDFEKPTATYPFKWEIRYVDASGGEFEVDMYEDNSPLLQAIEVSITENDIPADVLQAAKGVYSDLNPSECYLQRSHEFSYIDGATAELKELSNRQNLEFDECPNPNSYNGQMDLEVVDIEGGEPYVVGSDIYDVTNPRTAEEAYPVLLDIGGNQVTLLDNGKVTSAIPARVKNFAETALITNAQTIGLTGPFEFTNRAFADTEKPTIAAPFKWELKYTDKGGTEVEVDIYEGSTLVLQALEVSIAYSSVDSAILDEVETAISDAGVTLDKSTCIYQMAYEFKYVDGITGEMKDYPANKRNLELDECDYAHAKNGVMDLEVLDVQNTGSHTVVFDLYDTTNPKLSGMPCAGGSPAIRPCSVFDSEGHRVEFMSNGRLVGDVPQRVKTAAETALTSHAGTIGGTPPWTYTGLTFVDREKPTRLYPLKWEVRYTDASDVLFEVDLYESQTPQLQAIEKKIDISDVDAEVIQAAETKYPDLQVNSCFMQHSYEFSEINIATGELTQLSNRQNMEFDECLNPKSYNGQMDLEVVDFPAGSPYTVNADIYDVTNPKLAADPFPTLRDVDGNAVEILSNGKLTSSIPTRVTDFALDALTTKATFIGGAQPFTYTGDAYVDTEKPTKEFAFKWEVKYIDNNNVAFEVDIYEGTTMIVQAIEKTLAYADIDAGLLEEVQTAIGDAGATEYVDMTKCIYQMAWEYKYIDSTSGTVQDYPAGKQNLELDECDHTHAYLGLQDLEVFDVHEDAPHLVAFDLYDVTNPKLSGSQCVGAPAPTPPTPPQAMSDAASAAPRPCDLLDFEGNVVYFKSNGRLIGDVPQKVKTAAEAALTQKATMIGGTAPWTYTGKTYIDRQAPTKAYPFKWEIRYTDEASNAYEVDLYEAATPVLQAIEKSITESDVKQDVLDAARAKYAGSWSDCYIQHSFEFTLVNSATGVLETLNNRQNLELDECPHPRTYNGQMDLEVMNFLNGPPYTVNTDIYDLTNPKLPDADFPQLLDIDGRPVTIQSNGKVTSSIPFRVKSHAEAALTTNQGTIGATPPFTFTGDAYVDHEKPTMVFPFKWELKYTDDEAKEFEVDVYEGTTLVTQAIEKTIAYSDIDPSILNEVQVAIDQAGATEYVKKDQCIYQVAYEYVYIDGATADLKNYPANKRNLELDECDHTLAYLKLQDLEVLDLQNAAPHTVLFDLYDVTNPKSPAEQCIAPALETSVDASVVSAGGSVVATIIPLPLLFLW